jgi:hypothetical protein
MRKKIYLHAGQMAFLKLPQKTKVGVFGRGWGKTTLFAAIIKQMAREMPKAFIAYVSLTFGQVKNLSLGAIQKALKKEGLIKGSHYVVGKKPPRELKFKHPEVEIEDYKNIITFFNGFTINLISSKTSDNNRGGSYDAVIFDEAAFFKEDFYKKIIKPSIRGYKHRFIQKKTGLPSRWYLSQTIMTSRAWGAEGRWVYAFKEKMKEKPHLYAYIEGSSRENLQALGGEEWFEEQLDSLGALVYAVEIDNQDLQRVPDGYYHRFDDTRNVYYPQHDRDNNMIDIDSNRLLSLSFDFGGWFTCATLWQEQNNVEYCRREYFVKQDGTIKQLVNKIIDSLSEHKFKRVHIYGDPSGYKQTEHSTMPSYSIIAQAFRQAGWQVEVLAQPDYSKLAHTDRKENINSMLDESSILLPKVQFNKLACMNTIIAIGLTDVNPDGSKNKTMEKDRQAPQQHAPHLTDTTDYYLHPKWFNGVSGNKKPGRVWTGKQYSI